MSATVREWLPIESAPKDGTEILIYDPRADLNPVFIARHVVGHWLNRDDRFWLPTHWMPLPTLPPPPKETPND